jgi:hypothetical protein
MRHNINTQMDIVILGSALVLCCVILWRGLLIGREGEGEEGVMSQKREEKKLISQEREEEGRGEGGGKEEERNLFQAEKNYKLMDGNDEVKIPYSQYDGVLFVTFETL